MFDNIGDKLRTFAAVLFLLGIIASVVLAIISFANAGDAYYNDEQTLFTIMGLVYLVVGSLSSWLSSLVLYALGDIYDNAEEIARNTKPIKEKVNYLANNTSLNIKSNNSSNSFDSNYVNTICPYCSEKVTFSKSEIKGDTVLCPLCKEEFIFTKK